MSSSESAPGVHDIPDSEEERRLKKKARNKRYYEKRKSLLSAAPHRIPLPRAVPPPLNGRVCDSTSTSYAYAAAGSIESAGTTSNVCTGDIEGIKYPITSGDSQSDQEMSIRALRGPVSTFLSPNIQDWSRVTALNGALLKWGYTEQLSVFAKELDVEFSRMLLCDSDRAAWIRGREQWIIAGDALLDEIQDILFGTYMEYFSLHNAKTLWTSLTSVAFKVMYMMSALEARWDVYLHWKTM